MNMRLQFKLKRIQAGLKIKDIASMMRVSRSLISLYEHGQRNLSPKKEKQYQQIILQHLLA